MWSTVRGAAQGVVRTWAGNKGTILSAPIERAIEWGIALAEDTSDTSLSTVRRFMAGDAQQRRRLLDRNVIVHAAGGLPYSGEYRGPQGFFELLTRMREVLVLAPGPISHHALTANTVAACFRLTFTARASGASVEMGLVELYTVRDGLIVELDVYYKDPSAVAALLIR
jgi:uncharacterized protein